MRDGFIDLLRPVLAENQNRALFCGLADRVVPLLVLLHCFVNAASANQVWAERADQAAMLAEVLPHGDLGLSSCPDAPDRSVKRVGGGVPALTSFHSQAGKEPKADDDPEDGNNRVDGGRIHLVTQTLSAWLLLGNAAFWFLYFRHPNARLEGQAPHD